MKAETQQETASMKEMHSSREQSQALIVTTI